MLALFWISIILVSYAYFLYILILLFLSFFQCADHNKKKFNKIDSVSLLISAYNEQDVIEDKLKNSLELDYPKDHLEIVVVSDGSNDNTNRIVARYFHKGITLRYYPGRLGKTACLNKAVPLARGDIIVFSDANSLYDAQAIKHLVQGFVNKTIGFVTGKTKYVSRNGDTSLHAVGIYSHIENLTKKLETKIGSCVGADGAIFAIRKDLYLPLQPYDINDLVIPLKINELGFRGVLADDAVCIETKTRGTKAEFKRHVRITSRSLRAIFHHTSLLNPFKYPLFSFELISHKLIKFFAPLFLILMIITNISIVFTKNYGIYLFALLGQAIFYSLSWLEYEQLRVPFLSKLISFSHTFFTFNLAILLGWIKYFQGEKYETWSTYR
jgi:cellulose synthase/poly-beta-1,6-N-acetylglucosamine synthase-like glycosyltransferase